MRVIRGKKALVTGAASGIGAETAKLGAAFGMRVLGIDARLTSAPHVAELHRPEALDELLPRADFVILTIPHTPETEGLMNAARFQRMRRSAYFINIGRGKTTRLDDLVQALHAGWIAGAGIDVFEIEPLPSEKVHFRQHDMDVNLPLDRISASSIRVTL